MKLTYLTAEQVEAGITYTEARLSIEKDERIRELFEKELEQLREVLELRVKNVIKLL